jgi:hypothetical protein
VGVSAVGFPVFLFEAAGFADNPALGVTEQDRQVLRAAVSNRPPVVLGVPFRNLGLLLFLRHSFLLTFLFIASFYLDDDFLRLLDDDFLVAVVSQVEGGNLLFVLEADDSDDFTDATLNGEELVHEAQLQALLLGLEFVGVAEALKKDETLTSSVLGNLLLNELHHQSGLEMDG